MSEGLQLVTV
ncbi:uncharacterized protein ARMOST_10070 [Armillaria ostoyae]|uniref:Uncharacterized protein n=1 Tax=Armillaria ostoyae TaxID=47428 RepID=A0A284RDA8_ARMOS|nr:uncharacterized protein ARMOST_10070 [Armillaria ostoyae]